MNNEEIKRKVLEIRDNLGKRIALVASKNYTQVLPYFTSLLRRTRIPFLKRNGFWLGVLQISMLRNLPKFQEDMRKVRTELKIQGLGANGREDLEQRLMIYQEWIRIFQTITDGMAWRVLDFNRPVIRLLSENQGPGLIPISYAKILTKFTGTRSGVNLINDLTRCLRIGDITRVTKDKKIVLYEVKKDGRKIIEVSDILKNLKYHGPNSLSRQRHRHLLTQMSISSHSIEVPIFDSNGTVRVLRKAEIIDSDVSIPTHFNAIKKLIKKTNNTGFEQLELEEGYFVEITAWDKFDKIPSSNFESDPVIQRKKNALMGRPDWCKNKKTRIFDLSSIESFQVEGSQYPRNFTPQSVLPFSAKNCVRLMMGCLEIKVFLNVDSLKKRLEKEGWHVEYLDIKIGENAKRPGTGPIEDFMSQVPNEDFLKLSKSDEKGTYYSIIPATLIIFTLSSYYKIDFLVNAITDGFNRGEQEKFKNRHIATNFTNEKEVLI